MPGGHSKCRKKQKQNEEAKCNQGSLLGFFKPRNNDHPSSSGHEEDGTSTSVSARDDIQDAEEDGDPPTTVCGREELLEGCQLTDLRKTYSDDPADWIDRPFYKKPTITELGQGSSQIGETRYVQRKFFVRKLANEESVMRDWLVYSTSTGNVYCYVCKLFRSGSDSFSLNDFQ